MSENVRLQNLRDFTVQIRDANDQIVGTGIAVSTDGKIVTCAHVVRAAGLEPQNGNGAEITVYFPQARGAEEKKRHATIAKYFDEYDDDVVLLQLKGSSPLAPEHIPVLGTADSSEENPFRSYGYRRLDQYIAGWAHGTIQGCVEAPEGLRVQCEPVQLESSQINSGMSGSAVLDMTRNLVVGIVSETWFPDLSTKDRDTAWAVDGRVLSLEPLGLPLQDVALPLKPAPEPKTDEETKQQILEAAQFTRAERRVGEKISWNNAPPILHEWTGREHLLMRLTEDWEDPKKHVTGLIGFGGEGKSSLARKWVNDLLKNSSQPQPDGVFWWGFYENRSVDEFLEAALNYMSGGRIDPRAVPSSNLRAQIIGAMLDSGRYLFVLDGLEVMQHQEGDQYGLLQSNDLRDLLTLFARPDHQSFCLITSRAPVLDLMEYTTYTHRDVERLSEDDGRILLRVLGVKGSDAELNKVVADWGGHALTLSILAAYLVDRYDGDIKHLADIPVPTAAEPRYERVHRLLRRYDEHLTKVEREFLKLFSVFRLPVQESAFQKVFEPLLESLDKNALLKLVSRLVSYRIIRHDEHEKSYTTHPLIRNHYFALFTKGDPSREKAAHSQIKDYYLSIAGNTLQNPTLNDLKPLIEVVHHACQAGAYDEAFSVFFNRINQGNEHVLLWRLEVNEITLSLLLDFFPEQSLIEQPLVTNLSNQTYILNMIGVCLMNLGRLMEGIPLFERCISVEAKLQDWNSVCRNYMNLAKIHVYLGELAQGLNFAEKAANIAEQYMILDVVDATLAHIGWIEHLRGNLDQAGRAFDNALTAQFEADQSYNFLYFTRGIWYAQYLLRIGEKTLAHRITTLNLDLCKSNMGELSQCYVILGDYEKALHLARKISDYPCLIESLLGYGKWAITSMKDTVLAFLCLYEALEYALAGNFRIHEADVRVALAWAYLANSEKEKAKASAERALQMSNEMGYYWGKVAAEEILDGIESGE